MPILRTFSSGDDARAIRPPGAFEPSKARHSSVENSANRGFTLIELLIVIAVIGLLIGVAVPTYRNSQRKAREGVLQANLFTMRQTIDQYFADKGFYPQSLDALVDDGYLRKIPVDPITGEDSWDEVPADAEASVDQSQPGGIWDVRTFAQGETLDGKDYSEL